jgi:hypothetical protein
MTDGFVIYGKAPERRKWRPGRKVIAGMIVGFMFAGGLAFAYWMRSAVGSLSVDTSHPNDVTLTQDSSPAFDGPGQSKGFSVRANPGTDPAQSGEPAYTQYTTQATSSQAQGGCPAGSFTIAAGQTGFWKTTNSFTTNGSLVIGSGNNRFAQVQVALSASAPSACQDLAGIPLDVRLSLVP